MTLICIFWLLRRLGPFSYALAFLLLLQNAHLFYPLLNRIFFLFEGIPYIFQILILCPLYVFQTVCPSLWLFFSLFSGDF